MSELPADRLGPFEWLRAGAALGVVLLHACVPYLTHPMIDLEWPVRDTTSRFVNSLFWTIEWFIMPLFLVMAGFFVVGLLRRRGYRDFLKHRAARLLLPLIVLGIVILPLDLYSWLLGWVVEGQIDFRKFRSLKFDSGQGDHLWGLSHLWFLQYLFLYCVAYAALHAWWPRAWQSLPARYFLRRISVYALFGTGVAVLLLAPEVVCGFQHSFFPYASKWLYSGTFFAGGIWLAIYDAELRKVKRLGWRIALIGLFAAVAAVPTSNTFLAGNDSPLTLSLLAICAVTAAWGITVGGIGLAMRNLPAPNAAVKYLAAASFWIYLVHHPLIGLVHIDLKVLLPTLSPIVKTFAAFAITVGWCLATFEVAVRRTAIGRLLGLRTATKSKPEAADIEETATMPMRRAA